MEPLGDLEIELWATETPKERGAFASSSTLVLATGTGDGCESIYGQPYPDEVHPRLKFRYRGMMGVASAGRGTKTNGSQFFIAMGRLPSLDGKHTLFGKVVGQTIYNLVRLNEVEVDKNDIPVDPPRIALRSRARIVRAELVWDPFGDLEPRYKVGGPAKSLKDKDEHRRAPVHKKNVLSFAEDCSEEEEEKEETAAPGGKVKSAHDVLNDPRLLREVAYPEEVAEKKSLRDGKRAAPANEESAKRQKAAEKSKVAGKAAAKQAPEETEDEEDSDEEDLESEDSNLPAPKKGKSANPEKEAMRQEMILKLKKDIVGLANGLPAPEPRKKTGARNPKH
eukprot:s117_g10.t1